MKGVVCQGGAPEEEADGERQQAGPGELGTTAPKAGGFGIVSGHEIRSQKELYDLHTTEWQCFREC